MRFQVPQFIDVEDKIFGPLTVKQFVYLGGGAGLIVVLFVFFNPYIAALPSLAIAALVTALAFYKVNNRPFVQFLESAVYYMINPKLYVWKKLDPEPKPLDIKQAQSLAEPDILNAMVPKLSNSKLKDLTWSLDTREALNPATKNDGTTT